MVAPWPAATGPTEAPAPVGFQLSAHPAWVQAAQSLIDACTHLPPGAARTDFLEGACRALGPQLYPAFLEVLLLVGERGSPQAQAQVAEVLAEALASGKVPAAPRHGWGRAASMASWGGAAMAAHALGPLEYVCAAYLQPEDAHHGLSAPGLSELLLPLMRLLGRSPRALAAYAARLQQAAEDPIQSFWRRGSRQALSALAAQWRLAPDQPDTAIDAFLRQARADDSAPGGLAALGAAPPRWPR